MVSRSLLPSELQIEVSGWDNEKRFFVEKSSLERSEAGRRTVVLRSPLHVGSMVFVRLLASNSPSKGYPVAHCAESIEPSEQQEGFRVRLVESQPTAQRPMYPLTGSSI